MTSEAALRIKIEIVNKTTQKCSLLASFGFITKPCGNGYFEISKSKAHRFKSNNKHVIVRKKLHKKDFIFFLQQRKFKVKTI